VKPREKLVSQGVESLSDLELVAILLGSGSGREISAAATEGNSPQVMKIAWALIDRFGDLGSIFRASREDLTRLRGIGNAKAAGLLAVREVANRLNAIRPETADSFLLEHQQTYRVFQDLAFEPQEVVAVAFMTIHHRLIRREIIFKGTLDSVAASPREILRQVLRANAGKFIVAHNHPSQRTEPSREDCQFTERLLVAAEAVGVVFVDHMIICEAGKYFSFAANNLMRKSPVSNDRRTFRRRRGRTFVDR
jgi:DNA repair protein RadC